VWAWVRFAACGLVGITSCSSPDSAPKKPARDAGDDAGSCAPGEAAADSGCRPAGVPDGSCGAGFVSDENGGCTATLPADACKKGELAVPGETTCHEVAPCGTGTWGLVPVETTTEFVDTAYVGGNSDGTQAKPWTTIQAGVDAAKPGAIVAVAAGSYLEDVEVAGRAVRLWGLSPTKVEIVGTGVGIAALFVRAGASGTEVRDIAMRGAAGGMALSGSTDVLTACGYTTRAASASTSRTTSGRRASRTEGATTLVAGSAAASSIDRAIATRSSSDSPLAAQRAVG